jgi:hypothetical protein
MYIYILLNLVVVVYVTNRISPFPGQPIGPAIIPTANQPLLGFTMLKGLATVYRIEEKIYVQDKPRRSR